MKQIKSEKYSNLVLSLDNDNSFICFTDEKQVDEGLIENEDYLFELYRILRKADQLGTFDYYKPADEPEGEDTEVIYLKKI
jgi:hypothetical protein